MNKLVWAPHSNLVNLVKFHYQPVEGFIQIQVNCIGLYLSSKSLGHVTHEIN